MMKRVWRWFWRPSTTIAWGTFLIFGSILTLIFITGLDTAIHATNTNKFCISCHEMRETVYKEYKKSVHYKNAAGIRATCSDCHVPKSGPAKYIRKVMAANDIYHSLLGTISTPEKFEARREILANRVWSYMKASNSRECKTCHSFDAMDFHKQSRRAAQKMQPESVKGQTCIDCHKGVAHKLPKSDDDDD